VRHAAKNVVIVLALLGAGFALAWLRFRPWLEQGGGSFSDGRSERALSDVERLRYAVWDEAAPLAGEVNGPGAESHTSVSPDGRFVVFAGGERGVDADLFVGDVDGESVVNVRALAALSTPFDEVSPRFGAQHLYFASNRPGGAGGLDVWRAPFANGVFGEPERLGGALATEFDDTDPAPRPGSALAGREELVFASTRASGGRAFDLFRALPVQADGAADFHVEPLDTLNSSHDERDPAFAAGGVALVFASDRGASGADADFDLYRAVRLSDGAFAPPEELVSLNTPSDERAPDPSSDGFVLRFARDLGEGAKDEVLVARSLELYRAPGDPIGWEELLLVVLLLLLALLAWAAKHWRAMDVVYRCFVVSVIAHLLLLWWFQRVHPEASVVELAREGPRVRVQLGERESERLARRALGGELAAERSAATGETQASEPSRSESRAAELALASNVVPAAASFERASAPAARTASETALDSQAERSASAETATIEVADAAAEQQVSTRAARSESFDAARDVASAAGTAERARAEAAEPQRERVGASGLSELLEAREANAALANAAPSAVAPRGDELDQVSGARALDVAERGAAPRADDVALAGPVIDTPTRAASGAGAADLVATLGGASFERDTDAGAPARAESLADGAAGDGEISGLDEPQALAFEPATFARTEGAAPDALTPSARPNARPTLDVALAEADASDFAAERAPLVAASGGDTTALAPAPQTFTRGAAAAPAPQRASGSANTTIENADTDAPAPLAFAAAPAPAPERDSVAAHGALDATPYRTRFGSAKDEALREHGGTAATEAAVARGLDYLVSIQRRDGSWCDPREVSDKYGLVGVGRTGLCVLAFLGAGHTPQSNTQHSAVVARAIAWLSAQQLPSGHFGHSDAYSHGIATYALAEAFALTRDEALRAPIERAVAHVLANQRTSGGGKNRGGWSYYGDDGPYFDEYARTSITSWQVMALESARLGGIAVPDAAFENAKRFLLAAWDEELGAFRYSHDPSRLSSNWPTLPASTPAAMFALSLLGEDLASARYDDARQYVLTRATPQYRYRGDDAFVLRGQGNVYFSYYATLAMFRAGGGAWSEWNASLQPLFLESQRADGAWGPLSSYADYAGDDERDAAYSTAMAVLCLEVYYRYFTPLLAVELPGAAPQAAEPAAATETTETR
jgi:hypothetical protein